MSTTNVPRWIRRTFTMDLLSFPETHEIPEAIPLHLNAPHPLWGERPRHSRTRNVTARRDAIPNDPKRSQTIPNGPIRPDLAQLGPTGPNWDPLGPIRPEPFFDKIFPKSGLSF